MFLPQPNHDLRTYGYLMQGRKTPPPPEPLAQHAIGHARLHWRALALIGVGVAVTITAFLL